jgi:hypothetical protein
MCLTQPQIKRFVQDHRSWLRTGGCATLFLFKANNELFVAYVRLDVGGRLEADVCRFSLDLVWHAEYGRRIVVPQQTL